MTGAFSISRFPDGMDTDLNSIDWRVMPCSPGVTNNTVPGASPLAVAAALALLGACAIARARRAGRHPLLRGHH